MTKYVIESEPYYFVRFQLNPPAFIWDKDVSKANTYSSRYAAKKHLRMIDNFPEENYSYRIVKI